MGGHGPLAPPPSYAPHLLIECAYFNDVRQIFYQVPSLQDLFKTVKADVILDYTVHAFMSFIIV